MVGTEKMLIPWTRPKGRRQPEVNSQGGGHDPFHLGRNRVLKGRRVQYLKDPNKLD